MEKVCCEVCNSNHIVKEGDFFICESCGTKYKVEDLRKMVFGTVEVVPGKELLNRYYDDIDYLLSINRLREAAIKCKDVSKDYPREYKPWKIITQYEFQHNYEERIDFPRFEDSSFYEAVIRGMSGEEAKELLNGLFDEIKERVEYGSFYEAADIDENVYIRKNKGTCLWELADKRGRFNFILFPDTYRLYDQYVEWFAKNASFFYRAIEKCDDKEYEKEKREWIYSIFDNGILPYQFLEGFIQFPFYNKNEIIFWKHSKILYKGEEIKPYTLEALKKEHPDYINDTEVVRDLNVPKLYSDLFKKSGYEIESEYLKKKFEEFHREYKYYRWRNFLIFELRGDVYGFYINCDEKKITEDNIEEFKQKIYKSKEEGVCFWCKNPIDYSLNPTVCLKCRSKLDITNK